MRNWMHSNFLISLRTTECNLMAWKNRESVFSLLVVHLAEVSSSAEQTSSCSFRIQLRLTTLEFHFEPTLRHVYFICMAKKFWYCELKQKPFVFYCLAEQWGTVFLSYFTLLWANGWINAQCLSDMRNSFTPAHHWELKHLIVTGKIIISSAHHLSK